MLGDSFQDRLQGKLGQTRRKNFMNWIVECISFSDLITIFDIRTEENLDKKILAALLKGDLSLQAQVGRRLCCTKYLATMQNAQGTCVPGLILCNCTLPR